MWLPSTRTTELEAAVSQSAKSYRGIGRITETTIDSHSGLLYERARFEAMYHIEPRETLPDESWIERTLLGFIRDEFRGPVSYSPPPPPMKINSPIEIDLEEAAYEYLEACEQQLVFDGPATEIARRHESDPGAGLYELLTHPQIGNQANGKNLSLESFRAQVEEALASDRRLLFVFPGFPFKDQNRFRTMNGVRGVDLGEIGLLIRLHVLATSIYQVYQLGADWLVLSDGHAFADALRVDPREVQAYSQRLRGLRDHLDLGRGVSIIDYLDLVKFVDTPKGYWDSVNDRIEDVLTSLKDPAAVGALGRLKIGMKRNVDLRDVADGCTGEDWWEILHSDRDHIPRRLLATWNHVERVCSVSAIKYAVFNIASKWTSLERNVFPQSIRATVHAKVGQVAIPKMGTEFPWNGTALVSGGHIGPDTLTTRSLKEIAMKGRPVTPHVDRDGSVSFVTLD